MSAWRKIQTQKAEAIDTYWNESRHVLVSGTKVKSAQCRVVGANPTALTNTAEVRERRTANCGKSRMNAIVSGSMPYSAANLPVPVQADPQNKLWSLRLFVAKDAECGEARESTRQSREAHLQQGGKPSLNLAAGNSIPVIPHTKNRRYTAASGEMAARFYMKPILFLVLLLAAGCASPIQRQPRCSNEWCAKFEEEQMQMATALYWIESNSTDPKTRLWAERALCNYWRLCYDATVNQLETQEGIQVVK